MPVPTPSQTVGPFFSIGLARLYHNDLCGNSSSPRALRIRGRVLDGRGDPVPDAFLEIWCANRDGNYPSPQTPGQPENSALANGFARIPTNDSGEFQFTTIKPGLIAGRDSEMQAPHLVVSIFMRGLLKPLFSRIYFPNDSANHTDPVLSRIEKHRQPTVIARPSEGDPNTLEWTVHLQGENETVFFDI